MMQSVNLEKERERAVFPVVLGGITVLFFQHSRL